MLPLFVLRHQVAALRSGEVWTLVQAHLREVVEAHEYVRGRAQALAA